MKPTISFPAVATSSIAAGQAVMVEVYENLDQEIVTYVRPVQLSDLPTVRAIQIEVTHKETE